MIQNILNLKEFCIVTFPSTQSALQAEKVLWGREVSFLLIPTPREISTSCGLAVKCACQELEKVIDILKENKVQYQRVHELKRKT